MRWRGSNPQVSCRTPLPGAAGMLKLELKKLGIPFYDPMLIIEKTQGRMAEDEFYIKIERKNAQNQNVS